MKIRYIGDDNMLFQHGKLYEPTCFGEHWYKVKDECGGEFIYPDHLFERVQES